MAQSLMFRAAPLYIRNAGTKKGRDPSKAKTPAPISPPGGYLPWWVRRSMRLSERHLPW